MNDVAIRTLSVNEAIADALRPFAAKIIARKIETSERTVEHWKQAKTGPQAKHFVAMLQDGELRGPILEAIGMDDLARSAETITILKAALAQLTREAHGNEDQLTELIRRRNKLTGSGEGHRSGDRRPAARQRSAGDREGSDREVPDAAAAVRPAR